MQTLGGFVDGDVARAIVGRWKAMSPAVRREAVEILFSRRAGIEAVVGALETRVLGPSELDPDRIKQLLASSDPSLRARAPRSVAADQSSAAQSKPDRRHIPAGDPARGGRWART